jgi:kynurenine formamidase
MKIVDLTLEISSDTVIFPGYPTPTFTKWSKFDIQGYISEVMFLSTHTGTHMDAPLVKLDAFDSFCYMLCQ